MDNVKRSHVRRAAALVLALVMVLSTMTMMAFAADNKVTVEFKGLHNAQLADIKLYTYENDVKGTDDLLASLERVPDGYQMKYTDVELTPGDYWVDGYDENGDCNGGLAITVDADHTSFTFQRYYRVRATNSGWVAGTDYTIEVTLTDTVGASRLLALGTAVESKGYAWEATRTSFIFVVGDTVSVTLRPDVEKHPNFNPLTDTRTPKDTQSLDKECKEFFNVSFSAPAGSTVDMGTLKNYFVYTFLEPYVRDTEAGTATFRVDKGTTYFYRVRNPQGATYWNYKSWSANEDITITEKDLGMDDGEFNKSTIYHFENNVYDRAGIYLNINTKGYKSMVTGDTFELNSFRNWFSIESPRNAQVALPEMHYQVIDANGDPSDVVTITPNELNSNVAVMEAQKAGTAIVLVTYDAMTNMTGQSNESTKTVDSQRFSAIWPELTGVFVVTVDADGSAIQTNMELDRMDAVIEKDEARQLDAEHDILFYTGDSGATYSFKPETGCTVSVLRPTVTETALTYSGGFVTDGVTKASDGTMTVTGLVTGRSIIKVTKNGLSTYQVITARQVSYKLVDANGVELTDEAKTHVAPGDTVTVQFSNLISPKEKLSGVYNFNFTPYLEGEDGSFFKGDAGGGRYDIGVYDFSGNPVRQKLNITIPKYWIEDTYTLTGAIKRGGYAGVPTHRGVTYANGTNPKFDAPNVSGILSRLPEVSVAVNSSNSDLLRVQLRFEDETGKTVAVSPDEITIQDSYNVRSMLTADGQFGAVAGDFTYAVEKAGYEAKNGTLAVSGTALEFTITLTRTADKIAAEAVEAEIAAIGTVTKNSGEKLAAVRKAYESLTDAQKELVGNLGALTAAESRYERLVNADRTDTVGKPSVREDAGSDEAADDVSYSDVKDGDWFADAVQSMTGLGLMSGTGSGKFSPNADTTRAMIVTILARLDGEETSGTPWYAAGRAWAMENGVSDGTNMDGKITREQLCAMLYRYAQLRGYDTTQGGMAVREFADYGSISAYALDAMTWAVNAGLVQGRSGRLAPQGYATRAEIAVILDRFLTNIVK